MITPIKLEPDARPKIDGLTRTHGLWINGKEVFSDSTFQSIDPTTEEVLAEISFAEDTYVDAAIAAARRAYEAPSWSAIKPEERNRLMLQIVDVLEGHVNELASLDSYEMGSPLPLTTWMVEHTIDVFRNYAGWPTKMFGDTAQSIPSQVQYTRRQPLGVVATIAGWNGPTLQMGYKIAPALATGNTVVVKPSEQTSLSMLRLAELIAAETEIPDGVVNVVAGSGSVVGDYLMSHDGVDKVSFTGSTTIGKHILEASTSNLKHVTLELGGKSPYVIFEDADLGAAAAAVAIGLCSNSGEACVAGTRILVQESVRDQFSELLTQAIEPFAHGLGDPFAAGTRMGPIAFRGHYDKVKGYLSQADEIGARMLTGDEPIAGDGLFIAPTVIDELSDDSHIVQEEIFGPVGALLPFRDLDEMVKLANDTIYGLAASVWTKNLSTAHHASARIDSGTVWVNLAAQMSDGPLPFGGFKQSGIGREHGTQVLDAYTQMKSVVIQLD